MPKRTRLGFRRSQVAFAKLAVNWGDGGRWRLKGGEKEGINVQVLMPS